MNSLNQGCLFTEFLLDAPDDDIHHISSAVVVLLPDARQQCVAWNGLLSAPLEEFHYAELEPG